MKIVIVGGHLAPALAVIEALPKDTEILFTGRNYALEGDKALSLEYQKITGLRIPFVNLNTGRLQRKFTRHTLKSVLKIPGGFFQSLHILKKFKPDVVVCFGGYLQIPVAAAAKVLGIPIIIHEQTMRAGLANKITTNIAKTVCISWPDSAKYFPRDKTVLTGLPLRREFIIAKKSPLPPFNKGDLKTIYITGGSLGAHAINVLVEGIVEKLVKNFIVIHQTGDAREFQDFERLVKIRETMPKELRDRYQLMKFIEPEKVPRIMASSDLVISRAGMNTIAELTYLRRPCILIPLPHGQVNEQLENAKFIQKMGLGSILRQDSATPEDLYSQIVELTDKLNMTQNPAPEMQDFIYYDAAEKIVQIIIKNKKKDKQQKDKE